MSHKGTNWAIQQRGLKPATKLVLWYLCDRHNPDYGCFPSQEDLAVDAEMSRASLNEHLVRLEEAGLIRRIQRVDPRTKRQLRTRYILGFEPEFLQDPCPVSGHGPDETEEEQLPEPCPESGVGPCPDSGHGPCPENGESRVQILDSQIPVREPVKRKEEEERASAETSFEDFFAELLRTLGFDPKVWVPGWWQGESARAHVRRWMSEYGFDQERVLQVAEASRRNHPEPPDGPKALDRAMARAAEVARTPLRQGRRPAGGKPAEPASQEAQIAHFADWVNSDRLLPPNAIGNVLRAKLVRSGLVTEERLRERGVR